MSRDGGGRAWCWSCLFASAGQKHARCTTGGETAGGSAMATNRARVTLLVSNATTEKQRLSTICWISLWGKSLGWVILKQELLNVLALCCPEQINLVDLWQCWPGPPGWSRSAGLDPLSRKRCPLRTIVLTENNNVSFECTQPPNGASL